MTVSSGTPKPPIGIQPMKFWLEERLTKLYDAIERYKTAGLSEHPNVSKWRQEIMALILLYDSCGNE